MDIMNKYIIQGEQMHFCLCLLGKKILLEKNLEDNYNTLICNYFDTFESILL